MHVVTVDESKRVRLPDAKPGAQLHYCQSQDGTIFLLPVKKPAQPSSFELMQAATEAWDKLVSLREFERHPGEAAQELNAIMKKIKELLPKLAGELGA